MVWNQYIYEANVGYETENNSEDEIDETLDEYSGEDWEELTWDMKLKITVKMK